MPVKSKILGFDMDGVIVDNSQLKLKIAKSLGFNLAPFQTPAEIIKKIMAPEMLRKLQLAIYHNPLISIEAPLMPGIVSLLGEISSAKIPYFLISRRLEPEIAIGLLKKRGIWPKYFNESNALFVITPEDKNTNAKRLGVTHYVDDETKILSVLEDVPNKFLFDHLNVFPESNNYTKVASHEELAKYFL
ncbi:MAG: hypothetical protein Q7S12_04140 [bacterium]|nr:hypothetical protein [bacterium]